MDQVYCTLPMAIDSGIICRFHKPTLLYLERRVLDKIYNLTINPGDTACQVANTNYTKRGHLARSEKKKGSRS